MQKSNIRKISLQTRANIKDKKILSQKACERTLEYFEQKFPNKNLKIASFLSFNDELDTSLINKIINTHLPIIHPYKKHCIWFAKDTKLYSKNKYGINEPLFTIQDIFAPWELDIVIVPLVAFNEQKYRMGMGGGFYDYSFQFRKNLQEPIMIGIAFDEQQNNDIIIDKHDLSLDVIITPTRVL